ASMYFYQMPGDGETKPQPAMVPGGCAVSLPEPIEHVWQKLFPYAVPGIGNTDFNCSTKLQDLNANTPATVRKLHGIRQQIPNHLLQPILIAGNHRRRRIEISFDLDTLGIRRRSHHIDGIIDYRHDFDRMKVERKVAGDDARHVENVIDNLRLCLRIPPDRFDGLLR